ESSELFQALLDGLRGRAAVSVTPPTVRKLLVALVHLLECNQLHAVVALAPGLFPETGIPASVMLLAGPSRRRQDDRVTFIDLKAFTDRQRPSASITEEGIIAAQQCLAQPSSHPGICVAVESSVIAQAEHDL